jgi:hypothetical protein
MRTHKIVNHPDLDNAKYIKQQDKIHNAIGGIKNPEVASVQGFYIIN